MAVFTVTGTHNNSETPGALAVNYIKFTVTTAGQVIITASNDQVIDGNGDANGGDSEIFLFNYTPAGGLGALVDENDDLDGFNSLLDLNLSAGDYVLAISEFGADEQDARSGINQDDDVGPFGFTVNFESVDSVITEPMSVSYESILPVELGVELFDSANASVGSFATIQEAVDAADALTGQVTIVVAAGTYNENVVIDRSDVALYSQDGSETTIIDGDQLGGALGAIQISAGANNVTIGRPGEGFTIMGLNGNGAIEKAAIYLQGSHDDIEIVGNVVVARGDLGLLNEFAGAQTNYLIDANEFSGQTFEGDNPQASGSANQFDVGNNVARQLVVLGNGNGPTPSSNNIVFSNNIVSGTAGGLDINGTPRGNSLVTIDAVNTQVVGNQFTGDTDGPGYALRLRGPGSDTNGNSFTGDTLGVFLNDQGTPGTHVNNSFTGTAGDDVIVGTPGNESDDTPETFIGDTGNDTFVGGGGTDDIDGGEGTDTAVFAGPRSDYTIDGRDEDGDGSVDGDEDGLIDRFVTVTGPDGAVTTLTSVERLTFNNGATALDVNDPIQLYDSEGNLAGTFDTIQAAVDAAGNDATILISEGTYLEQVTIAGKTGLTLTGLGEVTITSPAMLGVNGFSARFGDNVRAVVAVNDSTDVDFNNIDIDGAFSGDTTPGSNGDEITGLFYSNSSGDADDVNIANVSNSPADGLFGLQHGSGLFIDNSAEIIFARVAPLSVSFTNGSITDFQKTGVLAFGGTVTLTGNAITGIGATGLTAQNGIQIADATGTVSGNTITGIGYVVPTGGVYFYSSGIIAYEPAGPLSIDGNTITGTGEPGQFTGIDLSDVLGVAVQITNNAFSDSTYGLYAYTFTGGEIGLDVAPVLSGNTFENIEIEALHIAPEESYGDPFTTTNPFDLTGTEFADTLGGSLGDDSLDGMGGEDTLFGGDGSDSITGGDDTDTAVYEGSASDYTIGSTDDEDGRVLSFDTVAEGESGYGGTVDTLSSIERLSFDDGAVVFDLDDPVQLFDGDGDLVGTFATVQEALVAAEDGYTLDLAAGDYEGDVSITKDVTIRGANNDLAGDDETRGAESVFTGSVSVSTSGVSFDGVKFAGGVGTSYAVNTSGLYVFSDAADTSVTNSVFDSATGYAAVLTESVANLSVTDSLFGGYEIGFYVTAGSTGSIAGNVFQGVDGITAEGLANGIIIEATGILIEDNSFDGLYRTPITAIPFGDTTVDLNDFIGAPGNDLDDNSFTNTLPRPVQIFPAAGTESFVGTDYAERFRLNEGGLTEGTTVDAAGGDDLITGSAFDDTLEGGDGADTLEGGAGNDTFIVTDADDTITDASGIDEVETTLASYTLDAGIENLSFIGEGAFEGTGNGLNNVITGGADGDTLLGLDGDDTLNGNAGANSFDGGNGSDTINGGGDVDTVTLDLADGGTDSISLGAGQDEIEVETTAAQVRLAFTSADVGNGAALDGNNAANEDGGLAVRIQAEDGAGALTGPVHRADDEGQTFTSVDGTTFDVRDLGGALRGDDFDIVQLGTSGADTLGGTVIETTENYYVNGGGGNDTLNGEEGEDFLVGGAGDDVLIGNAGSDKGIGGAGTDTWAITGVITSITAVADWDVLNAGSQPGWQVVSEDGTDVFNSVEIVTDGDGARTLLVGSGSGYTTIQQAIDAASDGDTILVAGGTFAGDVTVNKDVTIKGANAGILGTGERGAETVISGFITVTAAGVTLDGVSVAGSGFGPGAPFASGIYLTGNDFSLVNSVLDGSDSAAAILTGTVTGLDVSDNLFAGYAIGIYVSGGGSTGSINDNRFQGDGGPQTGLGNGVNSETSGVLIQNNAFDGLYSGVLNLFPFDDADVDLNDYVIDNVFTNNAAARPIQIFPTEAGQSFIGTEENETFNGDQVASVGHVFDGRGGDDRAFGSTGDDDFTGGEGNDRLFGGTGEDTLTGGLGDDFIDGEGDLDTATFADDAADLIVTVVADADALTAGNQAGFTVETLTEGTDSIVGVERIEGGDGAAIIFVPAGGSIQDAIDAANDGDIIFVAAGDFDEDIVIDKAITIRAAQNGVEADDRTPSSGAGETNLLGHATILASAGAVVIDGLRVVHDNLSGTGGANPAIRIAGGATADRTIDNTIVWSTVTGAQTGDRAIGVEGAASGTVTISDSYIGGVATGLFGTASWDRGIYFDGNGSDLNLTGTTIEYARTAVNLDIYTDSIATLDGNTLRNVGSGVGVGVTSDGVVLTDNNFQNVGTDFNYRNFTTDVTFDGTGALASLTPVNPANAAQDAVVILTGSGDDTITGTQFADFIDANNNTAGANLTVADQDVIDGGAGNDTIFGRFGDDLVTGGAGNDTLNGGDGIDTVSYAEVSAADNVLVNLTTGSASSAEAGVDSLTSFENAVLGQGDDSAFGSAGNNSITGGTGNDFVNGNGGVDTFIYEDAIAEDGIATETSLGLIIDGGDEGIDEVRNTERVAFANGITIQVVANNAVVFTQDDDGGDLDEGGSVSATAAEGVLANDINLDQGVGDQEVVTGFVAGETGYGALSNAGEEVEGLYGTLTLNADGSYSYTADTDLANGLAQDEVVTDVFTYQVDDGDSGDSEFAQISFTVTGVNDAPVAGPVVNEDVLEGGDPVTIDGLEGAVDPDGDTLNVVNVGELAAGVTFDAETDSFTFDPSDEAYDSLKQGAVETITVNYDIDDGMETVSTSATFTITGTNDAPVTEDATDEAIEDGDVITGNLVATDVDDDFVLTFTADDETPGFTLEADGSYSFDPSDEAYQSLAAGQTLDVAIAFTVTDEFGGTDTGTLTITVTGTNDAPVAADPVINVDAVEGGETVTLNGLDGASDVDGDILYVVAPTAELPAGVTFLGDGLAIDFEDYELGTVIGQNGWIDASPSSPTAEIVDIDGNKMLVVANDPTLNDFGGPFSPGVSVSAGEDASGADVDSIVYSFDFKPVSELEDGSRVEIDIGNEQGTDRYNFMAIEYFGGSLRLIQNSPAAGGVFTQTLLADNIDPAVFHQIRVVVQTVEGPDNDVVNFYLDDQLVGSGTTFENFFDATPADDGGYAVNRLFFRTANIAANAAFPEDGPGGNRQGFLIDNIAIQSFDSAASFAFDPTDPEYDNLAQGATEVVTVNYEISDGITSTPTTATFTVMGTNDAPVTENATLAVDEDDALVMGTLLADDVDDGAMLTFSTETMVNGFILNADGSYSFDPANENYQSLAEGEELEIEIVFTVTDEFEATTTGTLTITVTGTNDAPTAVVVIIPAVNEDNSTIFSNDDLLAGVSDVDNAEDLVITAVSLAAGSGGSLIDNGNGTYTYTPAANDDTGAVFDFTASDGIASVSSTATLDLLAVNDAIVAAPVTLASIAEDSGPRIITMAEILANTTDADMGDERIVTAFTIASGPGTLVDLGDGTYSYTAPANNSASVTFNFTASDGETSSSSTAFLDITPVNDAPVGNVALRDTTPTETFSVGTLLSFSDADGLGGVTYNYQWQQSDIGGGGSFTDIMGATGANFTPGSDQVNRTIRVAVSYVDNAGFPNTVTSAASAIVGSVTIATNGDDRIILGNGSDTFFALDGNDNVNAGEGDDFIYGEGGSDVLLGRGGNDFIDGGLGIDNLQGGLGNDIFIVDNTADIIVENAGQGIDTARASTLNYTLGANVENLQIVAGTTGARAFTGNASNNTITGGEANDRLIASVNDGNDTYNGAGGSDTYELTATSAGATVNLLNGTSTSAQTGTDTLISIEQVNGSSGNDTIIAGIGFNGLRGNGGDDIFVFSVATAGVNSSRDLIRDFQGAGVVGGDKIDLSGIDAVTGGADDAFTFIGTAAFSSTAGQLRYTFNATINQTIVEGDVNGDGIADFQVAITGNVAPTNPDDFLL